jgi:hypothetical protein
MRGADENDPRGPSAFAPTPEDAPRDRSGKPRLDEPETSEADDAANSQPELEEPRQAPDETEG